MTRCQCRATPPSHAAQQARQDGRDDRDIPARDRDDVADARRGEGRRQVAIDPIAEANEDTCGQTRPGSGMAWMRASAGAAPKRARWPRRGRSPARSTPSSAPEPCRRPRFERGTRRTRRRGRVRRRPAAPDRPAEPPDSAAGSRPAGTPRHLDWTIAACRPSRGELTATTAVQGPEPSGSAAAGVAAAPPIRPDSDRDHTRQRRPAAMPPDEGRRGDPSRNGGGEGDHGPAHHGEDREAAGPAGRDQRPAAAPTASQPERGISADGHEAADRLQHLAADELPRDQVVDGPEWLVGTGGDDLCCGRWADPRQRLELRRGRAVQVDLGRLMPGLAVAPEPPLWPVPG